MALVHSIWQDIRYGLRLLVGNLRHTTAAVAALAIGIGVSTTLFTAYKAMVGRPLDARNPGEMVNLAVARRTGAVDFAFSYPDYETYRDTVRAFSGLVAFSFEHLQLSTLADASQGASSDGTIARRFGLAPLGSTNTRTVSVYAVSDNYFSVLGVPAARGRVFASSDDLSSPEALISEDYWQRAMGSADSAVGRTVRLNGAAVTIVGITPRGFVGTGVVAPDFWIPMRLEPLLHGDDSWLRNREHAFSRLFARLASGLTVAQAQTAMSAAVDRARALHDPGSDAAQPASAIVWPGSPFPLPINRYAGLELTIVLILIASGAVLVVACANVASLQMARAGARHTELQMRLSLGATRSRLIRQLLTESALLGLLSGAVALALSWGLLQIAVTWAVESLPIEFGAFVFHVAPDPGIFAFACTVSLAASVLFGLAPAIVGSKAVSAGPARGSTMSRRTRRLQHLLVAVQVMLSLVLIIAGSLLIAGARQTLSRAPGYDAARVADLTIQFPEAARYSAERKAALMSAVRARASALPGIVAVTSAQPPGDIRFQTAVETADDASGSARRSITLPYAFIEPGYFEVLGIPVALGRGFQDAPAGSRVAVISESAARQLWPNQNPLGRRVRLGRTDEQLRSVRGLVADGAVYEINGVIRDIRGVAFDGSDAKRLYLPMAPGQVADRPLLVRARSEAAPLLRALASDATSIDPDLLVTASTLQDELYQSAPFVVSSLAAAIAMTLGLLGLVVALMGIYATVNYIVVRRTREVGIRMAIGASSRDILGLVLGDGLWPVVVGLVAGLIVASGAASLLDGVFFGIGTANSWLLLGVTLLFLAVSLAAALLPSRRALRVNPIVALRAE